MALLQKSVPGLAKFLGVETQGRLGLDASNKVQLVVEIEDYLGPNKFAQLQDNAVAQNGLISIEVPQNRFWRLKWVAMKVDTPAGVFTNGIINVVPIESGISYQLNPYFIAFNGVGNPQHMFGINQASGYGVSVVGVNARAGDLIQAQLVNGSGIGNNTVSLFVQFQELEV